MTRLLTHSLVNSQHYKMASCKYGEIAHIIFSVLHLTYPQLASTECHQLQIRKKLKLIIPFHALAVLGSLKALQGTIKSGDRSLSSLATASSDHMPTATPT